MMLEVWGMQSAPSLPLLPIPLLPGLEAPDRALSYASKRTKLRTYAKLNYLKWNFFLH